MLLFVRPVTAPRRRRDRLLFSELPGSAAVKNRTGAIRFEESTLPVAMGLLFLGMLAPKCCGVLCVLRLSGCWGMPVL
jgi:hypothetical protein